MDETFHAWILLQNLDQQIWIPELLSALKRRFEASQQKIVIDGRDCQWPQRVHRVSSNENTPGE
jgi:hypothetical protein